MSTSVTIDNAVVLSDSEMSVQDTSATVGKDIQISTSKFWASPIPDQDGCVYVLVLVGYKLPVSGTCNFKVLAGSVRTLGFSGSQATPPYDIVAPVSSNQCLFEAESGLTYEDIEKQFPLLAAHAKSLAGSSRFAVIALSKSTQRTKEILEVAQSCMTLEGRKLLPSYEASMVSSTNPDATKLIYEYTQAVVGCLDRPAVEIWPQFQNALSSIIEFSLAHNLETNSTSGRPIVVMVCGEKNVGKSTTCRAVINSLLSVKEFKENGVGFFECDVGQTEFTPSAVVSWSLVKRPLFEPPFMHMKLPSNESDTANRFSASFYGDLSPGQSPNRYYECLKLVYSRIPAELQKKIPLVVNTMGWMKSLGLALLIDTYRLVQPDVILHLRSAQDTSPHLTPAFFFSSDGINSSIAQGSKLPHHELLEVSVHRRNSPSYIANNCVLPPPFFLRALSTVGHLSLSNVVASSSSVKLLPKCDIPVKADVPSRFLFAGICHERVPSNETNRALLGSIVALCYVDVRLPSGSAPPAFLLTLPSGWIGNEWLGLGVVLAIDEVERKMTIATPLADHPDILARVNCVMRGQVTVSDSVMAEIVPEHLRQNVAPPALQAMNTSSREKDEAIHLDAQRFGGRRNFMRRKRGNASLYPRVASSEPLPNA